MPLRQHGLVGVICLLIVLTVTLAVPMTANAQETTMTGQVVSVTNTTVVINSSGTYQLFVYAKDVRKPDKVSTGLNVRVISTPGNEPGIRIARDITAIPGPATSETAQVVPPEILRTEKDIVKESRRYQIGVRTGVALDPELVLVGVDGQIGPIFNSNVSFRPVVELGIGEVTTLISLNADFIYRLPFGTLYDRWTSYVGGGVGVNLVSRSFDADGGRDFDDFTSDTAMNILGGVRRRGGMTLEMKTSIYADFAPSLRLTVGYTF